MGDPVIVAKNLTKVYKMGEQEVCALCGVSLTDRARRGGCHHGTIRIGQVHH